MKRINIDTQQVHFIGCWNMENDQLCADIINYCKNNKDLQKQGKTSRGRDLKKKSRMDISIDPNNLKLFSYKETVENDENEVFNLAKKYLDPDYRYDL